MTGIVSANDGTTYARCDVSGVYRLEEDGSWKQTLDFLTPSDLDLTGCAGIAVDPNKSDVVYAALGNWVYLNNGEEGEGAVLKTTDGGDTWERVLTDVHFGANEAGKMVGECIAVSPYDSNLVFVLAKGNSSNPELTEYLYKSENGGSTWSEVAAFPETAKEATGFIEFSKTDENTVYVGINSENKTDGEPEGGLYKSVDKGASWSKIGGSPSGLRRAAQNNSGVMFFAAADGVWKYDGSSWTDITPAVCEGGYAGIDINPDDESHIVAVMYGYNAHIFSGVVSGNDCVWTDKVCGGANGVVWNNESIFESQLSMPSDIKFVGSSKRILVPDWFGIFAVEDITASTITVNRFSDGISNTVANTVKAISGGNYEVMAGYADINACKWETDTSEALSAAADGGDILCDVTQIDYCESAPQFIAKAGVFLTTADPEDMDRELLGLETSTDGGDTWSVKLLDDDIFGTSRAGLVAMSSNVGASGYPTLVMAGLDGLYYSTDYGTTWNKSANGPADISEPLWTCNKPVISDRCADNTFYACDHNGDFYVSRDGGVSFTKTLNLESGNALCQLEASAEAAGVVAVSSRSGAAVYLSKDFGAAFTEIDGFTAPVGIAIGKDNVIYVFESAEGRSGIYAGPQLGRIWIKITDSSNGFAGFNDMDADKDISGKVYVSTSGRGVFSVQWNR